MTAIVACAQILLGAALAGSGLGILVIVLTGAVGFLGLFLIPVVGAWLGYYLLHPLIDSR